VAEDEQAADEWARSALRRAGSHVMHVEEGLRDSAEKREREATGPSKPFWTARVAAHDAQAKAMSRLLAKLG
jgi:hypothetical protein